MYVSSDCNGTALSGLSGLMHSGWKLVLNSSLIGFDSSALEIGGYDSVSNCKYSTLSYYSS